MNIQTYFYQNTTSPVSERGAGIPSPTSFDHQAPEPAETVSLGGFILGGGLMSNSSLRFRFRFAFRFCFIFLLDFVFDLISISI